MAQRSDKGKRGFSAREARALVWLLPVLAVVSWLVWEVATATADFGYAETDGNTPPAISRDSASAQALQPPPADGKSASEPTPELFTFDPNTVEYHDLVRLGFERGEALGIIKYRERGKVFEIPEDFAACYQVSEAMYRRLKPYIRIGEAFRLKKWKVESGELKVAPTGVADSRAASGELNAPHSGRADKVDGGIVSYAEKDGGKYEKKETYSSSGAGSARTDMGKSLSTFNSQLSTLIDLNTADSTALISVSGIGPGTVGAIMAYRARLGGFARVEQLAEVRGVTEQNYERIIEQIYVDPAVIQKIDINFAPAKILAAHPYMRAGALRKLLKERQLKGGWRSLTELETDDIFTEDELRKLGPYLIFKF